jgi:3-oxoacyl-[acyl-carrier-protein] synthase-3
MALFSIPNLRLSAVAAAVPVRELRNEELPLLNNSQAIEFARVVGIHSRRVAPPAICASDLCVASARQILQRSDLSPAEIGVLVFVTQTPDYPVPGNSVLAQHRLGLPSSAYLLDLNQGCAGYVYGLASLAALMSATHIEKGLLLVGDTITRLLSSNDRSTFPIFSDAGSATLLVRTPDVGEMHFNVGGDGQGADIIQVRGGGARQPFGPDSLLMREEERNVSRAAIHLSMRGIDVLHYSMKYVARSIKELLAFANANVDTPDYYVFHQANRILNDSLLKRLGIPAAKAPETLLDYGNTSCASIPVTICGRLREVLAQSSKKLLLSGFGAGFSWGSGLIGAESVVCSEILEIDDADAV